MSLNSTAPHKDAVKPRDKGADHVYDDPDDLTKLQEDLIIAFLLCSIVGWLCGGFFAACYIKTWVFAFV